MLCQGLRMVCVQGVGFPVCKINSSVVFEHEVDESFDPTSFDLKVGGQFFLEGNMGGFWDGENEFDFSFFALDVGDAAGAGWEYDGGVEGVVDEALNEGFVFCVDGVVAVDFVEFLLDVWEGRPVIEGVVVDGVEGDFFEEGVHEDARAGASGQFDFVSPGFGFRRSFDFEFFDVDGCLVAAFGGLEAAVGGYDESAAAQGWVV